MYLEMGSAVLYSEFCALQLGSALDVNDIVRVQSTLLNVLRC